MTEEAKYIRTQDDMIIVFPKSMNHSDFSHFNPKSAGFIDFRAKSDGSIKPKCWGKSVSLNIESNPDDSKLALLTITKPLY